jgi:transposase
VPDSVLDSTGAQSAARCSRTARAIGLDVHKEKTTVAIANGDRDGEVRHYGEVSSDLVTTERALRKIKGENGILTHQYTVGIQST